MNSHTGKFKIVESLLLPRNKLEPLAHALVGLPSSKSTQTCCLSGKALIDNDPSPMSNVSGFVYVRGPVPKIVTPSRHQTCPPSLGLVFLEESQLGSE